MMWLIKYDHKFFETVLKWPLKDVHILVHIECYLQQQKGFFRHN